MKSLLSILLLCPAPAPAAVVSKTLVATRPPSVVWAKSSPDGYHFAWLAVEGGKEAWLLDGKEVVQGTQGDLTYYHELGRSCEASLSTDGRLAVLRRSPLRTGAQRTFAVWEDGRSGPEYEEIYELTRSPSGAHLAYAARREGRWRVVLDGREQAESFPDFRPHDLRVSDSGGLDYLAYDGPKMLRVRDGQTLETMPHANLELSADGRHTLLRKSLHGSFRVLADGKPVGKNYPSVAAPTLSQDGARAAFFAGPTADGPYRAVIDGRETGPELHGIETSGGARFFFAPGGGKVFWFGRRGAAWSLFSEAAAEGPYRGIAGDPALAFSPSGRHRAYAAETRGAGWQIILDGAATSDAPVPLLQGTGIAFDGEDGYHYFEQEAFGGVFLVCASRLAGGKAPRCAEKARGLASAGR